MSLPNIAPHLASEYTVHMISFASKNSNGYSPVMGDGGNLQAWHLDILAKWIEDARAGRLVRKKVEVRPQPPEKAKSGGLVGVKKKPSSAPVQAAAPPGWKQESLFEPEIDMDDLI